MKLVVDTNILVSCMVKLDGRTAELFLNPPAAHHYYAPEGLIAELALHRDKIRKLTGATPAQHAELSELLLSPLTIIANSAISAAHWEQAFNFVKDIDEDDDQFVALALHLNCPLWTGDKKLVTGIRKKRLRSTGHE